MVIPSGSHGLICIALFLTCLVTCSAITFPSRKSWWSKQITSTLHVAGQLTEDQMKFAHEAGFKSVISLFTKPSRSYIGPGLTSPLPSTPEAKNLASGIGLNFSTILPLDQSWATEDTVEAFSAVFDSSPKPALLFDDNGYASAFVGLLHYLNRSKTDPSAIPKMDDETFFKWASVFGYNYVDNSTLKGLVLKVAGSVNTVEKDDYAKPTLTLPTWYILPTAWQVKPFAKNIYFAGQIESNQLPYLKKTGYNVVINLRKGVKSGGALTQEEVVLLNIKDRTGTYNSSGAAVRQTRDMLEANRIDPSRASNYISATSQYNYQSINVLQFGDVVGYNETLQREAFMEAGIEYVHFPLGGVYKYDLNMWNAYKDEALELGRTKNAILLHCRTGYRAAVVGMLIYGCLNGATSTEVLQLAYTIGYQFQNNQESAVVKLMEDVLNNREIHCKPSTAGGSGTALNLSLIMSALITVLRLSKVQ